jgi:hypothetical protein
VVSLDFASNSRYLISAAQDKTIRVWDLAGRRVLKTFATENHVVQVLRFGPGDRTFATGGTDGFIQIWETGKGTVEMRLQGHSGKVNSLAFHPKEPRLLSGGSDKTWMLWDINAGRPLKRVSGHIDQVTAVAFSPDGTQFATGSDDTFIRVWEYPDGKLLQTLKGHTGGIQDLRYDPVTGELASASKDGTVRVWNTKEGTERFTFTGHDFIVSALRFAPDGRAIISVSRDKTVKLWDVQTGKFLRTVAGERDQIVSMALSPDGKVIATGSVRPQINLMVYPLEVQLAERRQAKTQEPGQQQAAAPTEAALAESPQQTELELDLSALQASPEEEAQRLAYRTLSREDPQAALKEQEGQLNRLMKQGQFCKNARALETTAYRVLELAPYDKAAYHALVNVSIIRQDLKMIFLMSKIGQRALFLQGVYDYANPRGVEARLDFWQRDVFNPARRRAGTELVLDFIDCNGKKAPQRMPAALLALDVPVEALRVLASRKAKVNLQLLAAMDDQRFLDRIDYLTAEIVTAMRRPGREDQPVEIDLAKAPSVPHGMLSLDLSDVDTWGYPGETEFRLRRANGIWLTYLTDKDRRKQLLLPAGNYYLMVDKKVRNVFTIEPESRVPITVAARP